MAIHENHESGRLEETKLDVKAPDIGPMPFKTGQRIGRCVIQKLLGQGATADVYLAEDQELQWTVALKVSRDDRSGCQETAKMLLDEAGGCRKTEAPRHRGSASF